MSKQNNITNDHFKVGGTGHSGENVLHRVEQQQYTQAQKAQETNASLIPNQDAQHTETPAPSGDKNRGGSATVSANSSSNES